ncbi:MAG TPA: hypothetical protein VLE99_02275 [Candidatus Saccharimonadales bacterium]|nr:hypothetical protein [Candidatus Saccharimonadales bacterium]
MNWIAADLLMFVCSVVVYLAIRQAGRNKLPVHLNNLAWFGTETIGFTLIALLTHASFHVTWLQFLLLAATSVVLSYLPSITSLKSIALAPNPGYSLVLSKSYVIFTSFLAVPMFGAKLPASALLAILLIVGFSMLILIDPKKSHHVKNNAWVPLALVSFFGWGLLQLTAKYLFIHGVKPIIFLTYLSAMVTVCVLVEMHIKRYSLRPVLKHKGSFVLIGLAAMGFNFFNFTAVAVAPNVGFVNATNAASIAAVTVFSIILFKDEFSWRKLAGVFGVVAGLFTLFLS